MINNQNIWKNMLLDTQDRTALLGDRSSKGNSYTAIRGSAGAGPVRQEDLELWGSSQSRRR